jgi:hypothetical protein
VRSSNPRIKATINPSDSVPLALIHLNTYSLRCCRVAVPTLFASTILSLPIPALLTEVDYLRFDRDLSAT